MSSPLVIVSLSIVRQYDQLTLAGRSDDLGPERGVATCEEGVFAGVPAQEVEGLGMKAMMLAAGPYFMQQKGPRRRGAAVQIVPQAAIFAARRRNQRAQLGLEQTVLPIFGSQNHDECHSLFGQLARSRGVSFLTRGAGRNLLRLAFRHRGRDCTPS